MLRMDTNFVVCKSIVIRLVVVRITQVSITQRYVRGDKRYEDNLNHAKIELFVDKLQNTQNDLLRSKKERQKKEDELNARKMNLQKVPRFHAEEREDTYIMPLV